MSTARIISGHAPSPPLGPMALAIRKLTNRVMLWGFCAIVVLPPALEITQRTGQPEPGKSADPPGSVATFRPEGRCWSLAFAPDSAHLAFADWKGALAEYDLAQRTREDLAQVSSSRVPLTVLYSPKGQFQALIESGPHGAHMWSWNDGSWQERAIPGLSGLPPAMIAPNGEFVICRSTDHRSICIWKWPSFQLLTTVQSSRGIRPVMTISPDSRRFVVSCADSILELRDLPTGELRSSWQAHMRDITDLAFSPDGPEIVSVSRYDSAARLWDGETGQPRGSVRVPSMGITNARFTPDGTLLALAGTDGTIRFFDRASGNCRATLQAATTSLCNMAIAPNGRLLATADAENSVRVWDLPTVLEVDHSKPGS